MVHLALLPLCCCPCEHCRGTLDIALGIASRLTACHAAPVETFPWVLAPCLAWPWQLPLATCLPLGSPVWRLTSALVICLLSLGLSSGVTDRSVGLRMVPWPLALRLHTLEFTRSLWPSLLYLGLGLRVLPFRLARTLAGNRATPSWACPLLTCGVDNSPSDPLTHHWVVSHSALRLPVSRPLDRFRSGTVSNLSGFCTKIIA